MSAFSFLPENETRFNALRERYPDKRSLTLPALWMVQKQEGWISSEAMEYLAQKLECSPMEIYSVASYYTMFHLQPIGTHHIQLCKTLSCMLKGSHALATHIEHRLGIKPSQTTPDGRFTFSLVECLGACHKAPVVRFDETYMEEMDIKTLDTLLDEAE